MTCNLPLFDYLTLGLIGQIASPDSLASSWSSAPGWWGFIKVLLLLGLVLVLVWVSLSALRKISGRGGGGLKGVEIVGGLPLGPRRSLVFVRIGKDLHIIGATDHHLSAIGVISDPETVANLTSGGAASPQSFGEILKKFGSQHSNAGGSPEA